ncbi:MAG: serine hydrolase domain-containing protein [Pseudomonadota bacterium]
MSPIARLVASLLLWLITSLAAQTTASAYESAQITDGGAPSTDRTATPAADVGLTPDVAAIAAAYDALLGEGGKDRFTGATVVIVEDGATAYAKGYGLERVDGAIPVDPLVTQFRLASVSKTIVGSLLGIAIDRGAITSIDDPISRYAPELHLPANAGTDISARMLATHQAGFAERRQPFLGEGQAFPLLGPAYAASQRPPYIEPAGERSNYSNYGTSVLGLAVAEALDEDLFDLIEDDIFGPLGMDTASFPRTTVPPARIADIEVFYPDGTTYLVPHTWYQNPIVTPAGGLIASGGDMARYMISLMGGSSEQGIPALHTEETRKLIFSRLGATHPALQGFGALFMVMDWNGELVVEHGGRTLGSTSVLQLFPDRGLGVFVSITGEGGTFLPVTSLLGKSWPSPSGPSVNIGRQPGLLDLRATAPEAVLGQMKPVSSDELSELPPLDRFAGRYLNQRRSVRPVDGLFRSLFLGDGTISVVPASDGTLQIGWATGYRQIRPGVFYRDPQETDFPSGWFDTFAFVLDDDGKVEGGSWFYTDGFYRPVSGLGDPAVQRRLIVISGVVLLTGILAPLWSPSVPGRWFAVAAPFFVISLPLLYFAGWPNQPVEPLSFVLIRPRDLVPLQLGGICLAALSLTLVVLAVRSFTVQGAGMRARVSQAHLTVLAAAAALALVVGWGAGLIGWNVVS